MMKYTSVLVLVFVAISAIGLQGQDAYVGTIISEKNGEAIPYVNISYKNSSTGTVSDQEGNFKLKKEIEATDILFSAIGYEPLEMVVTDLMKAENVVLKETAYQIETIKIEATQFEKEAKIFGVKNKGRDKSIAFGNPQLGSEIGALVVINKPTLIKSANFVLNHAKGDSLLFRVNIYDYQNKTIGENLLKENILIQRKQKKGVITVDLSDYNLILENDVLLALEWIRDFDELGNKGITFDTKKTKKLRGVYLRSTKNEDFLKLRFVMKKAKPCFYFMGKEEIR